MTGGRQGGKYLVPSHPSLALVLLSLSPGSQDDHLSCPEVMCGCCTFRKGQGVDDFLFPGVRCKNWTKPEKSEVGNSSCVTSVDLVTLLPGEAG